LGEHVTQACKRYFQQAYPQHEIEIIDPLLIDTGSVFKPHFAYGQRTVPETLDTLANKVQRANGYLMVSPEYNHSMSPALAHLLNHFGSSNFAFKPSLIVTYSAGQWGGVRAAVGMRSFLSELGCLPVSTMVHVPKAAEVFDNEGCCLDADSDAQWASYFDRGFNQLVWWAQAAATHAEQIDPHDLIKHFQRDPSQRNAP
jgi:NAD(P)H-dependent FMN reductase|tara:strand:+ start:1138 stop:1737 length:600 start_codon:yes stop_codon:yes gene_type:complete